MSDWSDRASRKIKQKLEEKNQSGAVFLERQRVKKAAGVRLWDEVRTHIRKNVADLQASGSSALQIQSDGPDEIIVRSKLDGGLLLTLGFDSQGGTLRASVGNIEADLIEVVVTEEGDAHFQRGMIPTTPDSIATQMLDELLDI